MVLAHQVAAFCPMRSGCIQLVIKCQTGAHPLSLAFPSRDLSRLLRRDWLLKEPFPLLAVDRKNKPGYAVDIIVMTALALGTLMRKTKPLSSTCC